MAKSFWDTNKKQVVPSEQAIPKKKLTLGNRTAATVNKVAFSGSAAAGAGGDTRQSNFMSSYNPIFSFDFFEIPYEQQERRQWYRHFYQYDEVVGRAVDLMTNLPLSKITLALPEGKNDERNKYVLRFFQKMVDRIHLFATLLEISHELSLFGNAFPFAEDSEGVSPVDPYRKKPNFASLKEKEKWYEEQFGKRSPNYTGWDRLLILPIDQLRIRSFEFSENVEIEYIPTDSTKSMLVQYGLTGGFDLQYGHLSPVYNQIPNELTDQISKGQNLFLNTDPYIGSAVNHIARKRSSYDEIGTPIIDRCIPADQRILILQDGVVTEKKVQEEGPQDSLLTRQGRFRPQICGTREVQEEIVGIRVPTGDLRLTMEHPVLVHENGVEVWKEARDIRPGDLVALSEVTDVEDTNELEL